MFNPSPSSLMAQTMSFGPKHSLASSKGDIFSELSLGLMPNPPMKKIKTNPNLMIVA